MSKGYHVEAREGDADWTPFCEWVRAYLYVDRGLGLVCYRPRDPEHFHWMIDAETIAEEFNAIYAGWPVRVQRGGKFGSYVRFDATNVRWSAVRKALGCLERITMNEKLRHPARMNDTEIVDTFGLGYAMARLAMKKLDLARKGGLCEHCGKPRSSGALQHA